VPYSSFLWGSDIGLSRLKLHNKVGFESRHDQDQFRATRDQCEIDFYESLITKITLDPGILTSEILQQLYGWFENPLTGI